jgi:hypothetical protein
MVEVERLQRRLVIWRDSRLALRGELAVVPPDQPLLNV